MPDQVNTFIDKLADAIYFISDLHPGMPYDSVKILALEILRPTLVPDPSPPEEISGADQANWDNLF